MFGYKSLDSCLVFHYFIQMCYIVTVASTAIPSDIPSSCFSLYYIQKQTKMGYNKFKQNE